MWCCCFANMASAVIYILQTKPNSSYCLRSFCACENLHCGPKHVALQLQIKQSPSSSQWAMWEMVFISWLVEMRFQIFLSHCSIKKLSRARSSADVNYCVWSLCQLRMCYQNFMQKFTHNQKVCFAEAVRVLFYTMTWKSM